MFLVVFLSIWLSAHTLVLLRSRSLAALPVSIQVPLLVLLLLLALSYVAGRALGFGDGTLARIGQGFEWVGAWWVGFFLLLFLMFLALEAAHWVSFLALKVGGSDIRGLWGWIGTQAPWVRWAVLGLTWGSAAALVLVGHLQAQGPFRMGKVVVESPTPVAGQPPFRIVQLSDTHLGAIASESHWEETLSQVKSLAPDVLVLTGDLVEDHSDKADRMLGRLKELLPNVPAYAVLGNHEMYAGTKQAVAALKRHGIRLLRQEALQLVPGLWLAGIDDQHFTPPEEAVAAVRKQVPDDVFLILLSHRPAPVKLLSERPDTLVLAGHVHGGQIFPFTMLSGKANEDFLSGPYEVGQARLYLSNGSGTWGPPIRLGARPEIVLVEVR